MIPFRSSARPAGGVETPRRAAAAVRRRAGFDDGLRALARALGRPEAEVRTEADRALSEMAAGESRLALFLWRQLERLAAHAYRLDVDAAALAELRRLSLRSTLVFLPSHRSYLDPLILREALRRHRLPPNHVLGGVNVAFWPLGPIGRRAGYVFIRRRVSDDPVYRFVLTEYVRYLAGRGSNLEWYLEGGRTRTGKLRPPRLGLLAYLVRAHRHGDARDIFVVPTAIVYDMLYELGALEREEHGAAKPPEGLRWALRYARAQRRGFGRAYVRFGAPIHLADWLAAAPAPAGADHDPAVEKLAFEVCHRIERATPVTPTALVCLAYSGMGETSLAASEVAEALRPFLSYLDKRGIGVAGGVDLATPSGVAVTLGALTERGVLRRITGSGEARWSMARPFAASFYRNGAAPHFVNRALAELVAVGMATEPGSDRLRPAWEEALHLRRLLEFEFVFGSKWQFAADLREELALFVPDWLRHTDDPGAIWAGLSASGLYVAPRLLRSSFDAYAIVASELVALGEDPVSEPEAFVARCLAAGREASLRHLIVSDEAAAADPLRTATRLAGHRGLLDGHGHGPGLGAGRVAFAAEIAAITGRLEQLAELARHPADPVTETEGAR